MSSVTVEMWMDFGCPWSRISLAELDRAVSEVGRTATVILHSLRLDPESPADYGKTTIENLCEHLSIEPAQAEEMLRVVIDAGVRVGLSFDFHRARGGNSFDAHRLTRYAAQSQRHLDVARALFTAHFEDGLLISDRGVLESIAREIGLPVETTASVLSGDAFAHEVRDDEARAKSDGIERSPHFVINGSVVRSGVQYVDDWHALFREVADSGE